MSTMAVVKVRSLKFWLLIAIGLTAYRHPVSTTELCQDCSARRAMLTDAEITEIRIEYIKQQILKKLRLKEPPKITSNFSPIYLPEPLKIKPPEEKSNKDEDDFYGKTDQIVLFPVDGGSWCNPSENKSTICFHFQLPSEIGTLSVKNAEFWLYKETEEESSNSTKEEEFVITEVAKLDVSGNERGIFTERIKVSDGWITADLTAVVKKWLEVEGELSHKIYISCPTFTMGIRPPVSLLPNQKPFLKITVNYSNKNHRHKRNVVNCSPGIDECCRENLNISFADLGWDSWIFQPKTYNAYFCKGSCLPPSSVTNGNRYHSIIKQYKLQNPHKKEIVSCCTAEKLSELELIYIDAHSSLHITKLPDMVVESCGCV
ncbi:activin beta chain dawdle [Lycorma delicatula]|uniref:activin beta chain dawdle n=1 Tax=Lycorma delicatula TaxID=130591 RepID=UPI003F50E166